MALTCWWNNSGLHNRTLRAACFLGTALLAASGLFAWPSGVAGQEPPAKPAEPPAATPAPVPVARELTAADLEAFLDGLVPAQIAHEDIAGAVIVVVKDGKILFTKGYGYADSEKKTAVSPATTLFRPGSISKLFVWTAVMQLVEQGKLDLDRDVNEYLDFKIPATFPKPITLRHILTHTPGFEESVKDLFVPTNATLKPLGEYLASHLPRRMFPPGVTPAYSNYGTAMAGYIVQRVSGVPLEEYIEKFIFQPLGMERSTFRQPLPEKLKPLMSQGYNEAADGAKSFEMVQAWPAGSLSTPAEDIARFMLAHLQDGRYENAVILKPETVRLMHSRQYGRHDAQPAMALGFYEETSHGQRIVGHGGDTAYFHSDLHLMLDAGVGFFISYNSGGRHETGGRRQVWTALLDRYFAHPLPAATAVPTAEADARELSGGYIVSRRSDGSLYHAAALLGQLVVNAKDKGELEIPAVLEPNGRPVRWQPVARYLYREVGGERQIAFRKDEAGRFEIVPSFPAMTARRAFALENENLIFFTLVGSLLMFVLTLAFWPLSAMVRKHYGQPLPLSTEAKRMRLWMRFACLANLLVVAGWAGFVMHTEEIGNANSGVDWAVLSLAAAGWISIPVALLGLVNLWRSVTDGERWWGTKIHDALLALACIAFVLLLWDFNMLKLSTLY